MSFVNFGKVPALGAGRRRQVKKAPALCRRARALQIILLEDRVLPSAVLPYIVDHPGSSAGGPFIGPQIQDSSLSSLAGQYITPAQIQSDYGLNLATYGSVVGNGLGQTIAVVDAYDDPNILTDLTTFDNSFTPALPAPPSIVKVNQNGVQGSYPSSSESKSSGWSGEEALDVEYAHVMAPMANIVIVEANSDNTPADIAAAVSEARSYPGVSVVSMSFGYPESSSNTGSDSTFATLNASHTGVTFLASSGDEGAYVTPNTKGVYWPAENTNVIGVGGTTLSQNSGTYTNESGWGYSGSSYNNGGSGGGIATLSSNGQPVYPQPSYQVGKVNGLSSTERTVPDISMDADPNSGVAVLDSWGDSNGGWDVVGGTSLASPMMAGLMAVANQVAASFGATSTFDAFGSPQQALTDIYNLPAIDFHDVTSGNNGYAAGNGYDLVTGIGTPYYNRVVSDLAGDLAGTTITLNATLTNGNLAITGGAADDSVTIVVSGSNYVISSATSPITAVTGTGLTQVSLGTHLLSTRSISVPIADVTGTISFNGGAGNDTLTVDYSGGAITKTISFNGGTSTTADSLILKSGTQGNVAINYTGSNSGSIAVSGEGTVNFTNAEYLDDTGTITNLAVTLPAASTNTITLGDDGSTGNAISRFSGSTIPTTDFANPTTQLFINRGTAADTLAVNALPDFTAGLSIGAAGSEFGSVAFNGALTLAANKSLSANATGSIALTAAASDLATSGTGTISFTTSQGISLASGSSLTAVNGAITLNADQQATPTAGNFIGVKVSGGTIQTTGTGAITIAGSGGTGSGGGNYGIDSSGGKIAAGGALTLLGIAADAASPAIHFDSASAISSGGTAALNITADSLEIADAATAIKAGATGTATATISPRSAGTAINLGGADVLSGSPLTLGITDAELDTVSAGTLIIGSTASGPITVSANLTRPASTALQLLSGGDISTTGGQINTDGGTLLLTPGSAGSFKPVKAGVDVTASSLSFASAAAFTANLSGTTVDTQYTQLNASGTVNLAGSSLVLTGSYAPNASDAFTIVSAGSVSGTFTGMPDGTQITFNNRILRLNYTATTVTLTAVVTNSVTGVVVNGGAVQRSRLTTITVSFQYPIDPSTLTSLGAITLTRTASYNATAVGTVVQTGAVTDANGAHGLITVTPSTGLVTSITLTFSNTNGSGITAGVEYTSLADGVWQLAIPSLGYASPAGSLYISRLFGDINGDGTVDALGDQLPFGAAFGSTAGEANYVAAFDYNNDGTISALGDELYFGARFGFTLP